MKTATLGMVLTAALFFLPAALSAQTDYDDGDWHDAQGMMCENCMGMGAGGSGMGMGMGGCGMMNDGHGRRGMMSFRAIRMLDLSSDQRTKLNKVQTDLRKQHWNLTGKILDEHAKLYDLYAMDRPDPKKIGQVYSSIFDIRRQMIETKIDAMNRARDILTKEQIEKLKQFGRPGGWGAGRGAGGGYHGQMMQDMMQGGTGTAQ